LSQNTRDIKLSYGENPKSLSHLVLKRYRVVTDGWTDRITVANVCYIATCILALMRKNQ